MTPEELADRLLKCDGLKNKKIRLLSCLTGFEKDDRYKCFARKLSKLLNRVVEAPNAEIEFNEDGKFLVTKGKGFSIYDKGERQQ